MGTESTKKHGLSPTQLDKFIQLDGFCSSSSSCDSCRQPSGHSTSVAWQQNQRNTSVFWGSCFMTQSRHDWQSMINPNPRFNFGCYVWMFLFNPCTSSSMLWLPDIICSSLCAFAAPRPDSISQDLLKFDSDRGRFFPVLGTILCEFLS